MDANKFPAHIKRMAQKIERYATTEFPGMAVNKTLRFIDGNFRAQGFQGRTFERWKRNRRGGTILVHRGHLRRSNRGETQPGKFTVYNYHKAAKAHNRGFKGQVTVRSHTRRRYAARRVATGRVTRNGNPRTKTVHEVVSEITVKQHVRNMNMPKRQFLPETARDSPVLVNSISRQVKKDIKHILNA